MNPDSFNLQSQIHYEVRHCYLYILGKSLANICISETTRSGRFLYRIREFIFFNAEQFVYGSVLHDSLY